MQHANTLRPGCIEPDNITPEDEESEGVVILAWAVPTAAKVPTPRQAGHSLVLTQRCVAINSTVPARIITELRANNTVLPTHWFTTATLVAPIE